MKNYVSPKIKFEKIQTNEKIAHVCWGYFANGHGQGYIYYDTKGVGYVRFTLDGGGKNCKSLSTGGTYSIEYIGKGNAQTKEAAIKEITDKLNAINDSPNGGSPYSGEFYPQPGEWS